MIIWGLRTRGKTLGQVQLTCPNCHRPAMTGLGQSRRWFTLFFIPIFPISGSTTTAVCGLCGYRYQVDTKQAQALLAQPATVVQPPVR
jgi:hypothetical protein